MLDLTQFRLSRLGWRAGLSLGLLLAGCSGDRQTTPNGLSQTELMDPELCGSCHEQHYAEWSGSMHAYASEDPLFVALNQRAQTEGHVGALCLNCHAPLAVRTGMTVDGSNLSTLPAALKGVTCFFCHQANDISNSHNGELHLANDDVMRGGFQGAIPNSAHASAYSGLHDRNQLGSSSLCGSCHDVVNGHGTAIERTFIEWKSTAFAASNGNTCGQCHMDQSPEPTAIASVAGAPLRARHSHQFPGVDLALHAFPEADAQRQAIQTLLDTTLQTALCVRGAGKAASLQVVADNVASGHKWPSGAAQDRRAWFEVAAFANGSELYHSGNVPNGTDPTALNDPDLWLVRDCMLDENGNAVDGLWDATSVDSNLLPGQLTFDKSSPLFYQTHVTRSFPHDPLASLPAYPDRATLTVHLLPFPLAFFDQLFSDPAALGLTADAVSALRAELVPLTLGQELVWTAAAAADTAHGGLTYIDQGVPVSCVTTTGMNAAADKIQAPEHMAAACGAP
ncbi:MAG TPA: multiheme c-type cytochrome [Polyangiaceae bacterium]|nr:multiheme c-type cytochrome [Polyangiaceae bacterium]